MVSRTCASVDPLVIAEDQNAFANSTLHRDTASARSAFNT
jgi:hypothetical protein